LDHCGALCLRGLPEDPVEWTLDPERYATSPPHAPRLTRHNGQLLECTQCSALRLPGVDTWTPDGEALRQLVRKNYGTGHKCLLDRLHSPIPIFTLADLHFSG